MPQSRYDTLEFQSQHLSSPHPHDAKRSKQPWHTTGQGERERASAQGPLIPIAWQTERESLNLRFSSLSGAKGKSRVLPPDLALSLARLGYPACPPQGRSTRGRWIRPSRIYNTMQAVTLQVPVCAASRERKKKAKDQSKKRAKQVPRIRLQPSSKPGAGKRRLRFKNLGWDSIQRQAVTD